MMFAVDIVKITDYHTNFLPPNNTDYPVYGEDIYSPMDGIIVKAENSIPDNIPYSGNYPYNTGNTLVIRKDKYYFLLGHLQQGSILVKEGDSIRINEKLAKAGNSGWTERPHLHMQLIESDSDNYWFGQGVSTRYQNKNLYKNRLIKIK